MSSVHCRSRKGELVQQLALVADHEPYGFAGLHLNAFRLVAAVMHGDDDCPRYVSQFSWLADMGRAIMAVPFLATMRHSAVALAAAMGAGGMCGNGDGRNGGRQGRCAYDARQICNGHNITS